jgi:hypothetical protein
MRICFICVIHLTLTKHTFVHTAGSFTVGGENEHRHAETNGIALTTVDHMAILSVITVAGKCLGVRVVKCIQVIVVCHTALVNVPNNLW